MRDRKKKRPESKLSWLLYILLIALIAMYAVFQNIAVGAAAFILIIIILVFEVRTSIATEGAKRSAIDIAAAVGAAVVFWILLIIVLQTPAPIDAVSSCSMLPALGRGDLVVLHGIGNMSSFIYNSHVPVVNVSAGEYARMQGNMSNEFLAFFAYLGGNRSRISANFTSGQEHNISLYSVACISRAEYYGKINGIANCTVTQQEQQDNLIKYAYSIGTQSVGGRNLSEVYTSQITIGNTTISENHSNPIIVYQTTSKDSFTGSIIHRLYAILNVSGKYYFLTKGDNNPSMDIEFGNYPANQSAVLGYVIADIPVLGYVKLLLSGQIATPAGCGSVLSTQ